MSLNVNNNVGYTVVDGGNIHIENGVVSGFSTDNYLDVAQAFDSTKPFQIHIKVNSFSATNRSQYIFGLTGGGPSLGLYLGATATGMSFSYGNSYWTPIATNLTVGNPLTADLVSDGTNLSITITQDAYTKTSTKTLADLGVTGNYTLRIGKLAQAFTSGSIDLNNTYIKVNGVTWFNGKQQTSPTVNDVYLNRNVGYDIVGNPTIVDGVLSESSTGNYIKPSSTVPFSKSSSWEFVSRFQVKANTTGSHFLADFAAEAKGFDICLTSTSLFWELGNASGSNWQYSKTISYTFDPTIFYSVKLSFGGNLYSIWLKTDTTQWTKLDEYASTTSVGTSYYNAFGYSIRFAGRAFNGSIDLNNTYIKVNGITWFSGKERASKDVNYVIKDGKLVWANPNLYLKSSGAQYINTELTADGNTTYEIKLKRGVGANSWLFGQDGGYAVNAHGVIFYENSGAWFYGNKDNGINLDEDVIYILKSEIKDNKYIRTINLNPFMSNDISSFSSPGTFILFGHFRGGIAMSKELSIYYSKIFQNNDLIKHLVPVPTGLKIGDYTVPSNGMWDIVSQQFFGNSGTGEFSYGKD